MRIKSSFVLLITGFLLACTGGNEVPNMSNPNIIKGSVLNNSTPLANSKVTVQPLDVNATGALIGQSYTTTTDSKGEFEIEVENSGLYSVTALDSTTGNSAISSEILIEEDRTSDVTLEIKKSINLTGKVSRNKITDINVFYVFIPGTKYIANSVDENGFYIFKDIPQGTYPIAFTYGNKGSLVKVATTINSSDSLFLKDLPFVNEIDSLQSPFNEYSNDLSLLYYVQTINYGENYVPQWQKEVDFSGVKIFNTKTKSYVEQTNIKVDTNTSSESIILDDFENSYGDSPSQNALAALYGKIHYPYELYKAGGYWYVYSDTIKDGGNSIINPAPLGGDISPLIINNEQSLNNNSLFVEFTLRDKIEYPFAGVGFIICGTENDYHDLSSMDKFTFWAKGEGVIRLKFFSSHDDSAVNDKGHFGKDIALTSEWKLYEIYTSDITAQADSETEKLGITWSEASKKVNKIHFETPVNYPTNTPVKIYLDDIVIHGVSLESLTN